MKNVIITTAVCLLLCLVSIPCFAERQELSDGTYVDENGDIHDHKFENTDIFAPWNDPLKKDDPLAPWNSTLQKDDPLAPWNDPIAGQRDTNSYLRESGERDAEYYWK